MGPNDRHAFCAGRIGAIDRLATYIAVAIHTATVSDRVRLQEASECRRVDARLIIIRAELRQPRLARILEPAGVSRARDAVFVVGVDGEDGAGAVRHRRDAASLVAVEEPPVRRSRAFVPGDRLVGSRTMDIAALESVGAVILGDEVVAVISEPGGAG